MLVSPNKLPVSLLCALSTVILIATFAVASPSHALSQQASAKKKAAPAAQQDSDQDEKADHKGDDAQEEPVDDDPAAVTLDVSKDSPVIRELYLATRQTKEKDILAHLDTAKKLIADGADVKSVDADGRTALHWAVFGSSYNTKTKILVAYEEIADALVQKGVEINHEDVYQDTALDYLLYSPNFEMQTLLVENGATSGFLTAFYKFFDERTQELAQESAAAANPAPTTTATAKKASTAAAKPAGSPDAAPAMRAGIVKFDLAPGQTLSVRLDVPVYSNQSRTGDPVTATVTYPLCKNGEQVECKPGELIVPPGTKINGTVLFAKKAPDKYSRPRLVLDFSNVVHSNGQVSPLYARVLTVDNARETIENNEILGIVQPHASGKVTIAMAALSAVNPIAGYTIKGVQTVYGLSIRREIAFPTGTDMQIQVVRPSVLKQKEPWGGWQRITIDDGLTKIAVSAPLRTASTKAVPSDPTNLMFLGTRDHVVTAFGQAGWFEADDVNVKSAMKVAGATLRGTGYGTAPMSVLTLEGRQPDLMFQKSLNTFAKRHHLRIWKLDTKYNGQDVWVAAATHDIETTRSKTGTKWNHRIDAHIDRERDWVSTDILFAVPAVAYTDVERPSAPKKLANATGDTIVTDGKISVLQLAGVVPPTTAPTAAGSGTPADEKPSEPANSRPVGAAKGPSEPVKQ
jgi:ankyrin repeat protein